MSFLKQFNRPLRMQRMSAACAAHFLRLTAGKGGLYGFNALIRALEDGCNVAMTADVPEVSRAAGRGIVKVDSADGGERLA